MFIDRRSIAARTDKEKSETITCYKGSMSASFTCCYAEKNIEIFLLCLDVIVYSCPRDVEAY